LVSGAFREAHFAGAGATARTASVHPSPASEEHPAVIAPPTTPPRALVLENIHPDGVSALTHAGCDVSARKGALDEADLVEALAGVQVLGIRSKTQVTEKVLAAAPDLVAIGAFCIGTNQIDLAEASRRGIAVFNAPFSNTRSVVELALAEIISLTRRMTEKNRLMHAGVWDKSAVGAHEVRGRTLGIVGYGNIGTQLSVLAENLGMRVLFYDTADKLALGNARRCETLIELLEASDVVTLHVDGRSGNAGFFGEKEFAAMRPGAQFLNLSRGFVVDYEALRAHLESGHLVGAGIDVFPDEPLKAGDEFVSPLRGLENVILTPHIGGSTEEAQQDIGRFVGSKLSDYLLSGATSLSVNMPQLVLPEAINEHRLIHVHRNTPGVLAAINSRLAAGGVNIDAQYLGTRGELGYVITDCGSELDDETCRSLQDLPETIRLRVLH
jgi:D-3-phosphoglycerate dehydrogenase / 2-oxoglutarate reductase